jgi:hypothetical protein
VEGFISVKRLALFGVLLVVAMGSALSVAAAGGFDQYGYNDSARIFNGPADGLDGNLDGTVYGDPTYAKDKLTMKWNAAWDACNDAGNLDPDACSGAWLNNEWNGKVKGGSNTVWHYKIVWIGPCGVDGTPTGDGGYCLWGAYEVLQDKGTDPSVGPGTIWYAHAKPNGYGAH